MKTLQDIKGHENVKRAIKIALIGNHSIAFLPFKNNFEIGNDFVKATKNIIVEINKIIPDNKIDIKIGCFLPCPCGFYTDPKKDCTC